MSDQPLSPETPLSDGVWAVGMKLRGDHPAAACFQHSARKLEKKFMPNWWLVHLASVVVHGTIWAFRLDLPKYETIFSVPDAGDAGDKGDGSNGS